MINTEGHEMNHTQNQSPNLNTEKTRQTEYDELQESLAIFDFSSPLPIKHDGTWRLFYNNCNGLEINAAISSYIKQKREKKTFQYLKDIETPTKVDGILRLMKIWEVDLATLAEVCVAWEESAPRRVIQNMTRQYERTACWTVSSSKLNVGTFVKPGGTGMLAMGSSNGRIIQR